MKAREARFNRLRRLLPFFTLKLSVWSGLICVRLNCVVLVRAHCRNLQRNDLRTCLLFRRVGLSTSSAARKTSTISGGNEQCIGSLYPSLRLCLPSESDDNDIYYMETFPLQLLFPLRPLSLRTGAGGTPRVSKCFTLCLFLDGEEIINSIEIKK